MIKQSYITIISFIILLLLTSRTAFSYKPLSFKCNNFVLNSYLYLLMSLLIMFTGIFLCEEHKINLEEFLDLDNFWKVLGFGLFMGVLCFILVSINPKKFFIFKHIFWIGLIIFWGAYLHMFYDENKELFKQACYVGFSIISILTLITFSFPKLINVDSTIWLFISILACILFILLFVNLIRRHINRENSNFEEFDKRKKLILTLYVFILAAYVMLHTKSIIHMAKLCKGKSLKTRIEPDYINSSLTSFYNVIDMITSLYLVLEE